MLSAPQEELRDVKKAKESATATGLLLQNLHRSNNEKIFKRKMKIYLGIAAVLILLSMQLNQAYVAVQEAYKPDYYDVDFDVFENFTATASSLTMDSDSLVKGDASGDASGVAAGSVHTGGQDYDDCNAEFEYCDEESAILENKIYNVSEK
jgi:hypothetical protein